MPQRKLPTLHPAIQPSFYLLTHLEKLYSGLQKNKLDQKDKETLLELSVTAFKAMGFSSAELTAAIHSAYPQEISPTVANLAAVMPVRTSTPPPPPPDEKPAEKTNWLLGKK